MPGDEVGYGDAEGDADENKNGFNAVLYCAQKGGERQTADIDQGEKKTVKGNTGDQRDDAGNTDDVSGNAEMAAGGKGSRGMAA